IDSVEMRLAIQGEFGENLCMNSRSKRNKWVFRAAAVAVATLPFLVVEVGLQIFGGSDDRAKLSQGMQPAISLFTFDEDSQQYRTSLPYQQFFAEVAFGPKKTEQSSKVKSDRPDKLIFVLGGSTVQGRPFAPQTAFPAWAEDRLNHLNDGQRVRIVNCGGVSFASNRLSRLVPELLSYQPDLIVIATGHNEFLEDHTYQQSGADSGGWELSHLVTQSKTVELLRSMLKTDSVRSATDNVPVANHELTAKLDNKAGYETYHYDPVWHTNVVNQFRTSIVQMVEQCQAESVPVCLIELAANSRDCAPLKSEHASSVSETNRLAWRSTMDQAEAAIQIMDWAAAISLLQDCVSHSSEHALTHFRLARCFQMVEQFQDASRHFSLAVDQDVCPLRMKSDLTNALRNIAEEQNVRLIRCDELLAPMLENDSRDFGFELFLDHVHPTIRGHQAIGRELADVIVECGVVESPKSPKLPTKSQMFALAERRISAQSEAYFKNGRRRIGWLENWARAQKTAEEVCPATVGDLAQRIRRQLEIRDDSCVSALATVLVNSDGGNLHLIQLAEDFLASGQQQPAAMALMEVNEAKLNDAERDVFQVLQGGQPAGFEAERQQSESVLQNTVRNTVLSVGERSLIHDVLRLSED
ncbi:MAG: hypothetical protein ABJZ55_04780, partial [Fuerstiella sp.]